MSEAQRTPVQRTYNWGPVLVFLGAMLWAFDAPLRTKLLEHLTADSLVLGEHFFGALFVLPILWTHRSMLRSLSRGEWAALAGIAIGGSALATFAFTWAFAFVNPSVAILLQKLQPFIAILLAHLFLDERLRRSFWLWALLAIGAAYLLSFPKLVPRLFEGETFNPNVIGSALAISAAVLWAASTVLGKYALRRVDFTLLTALRFFLAFLFLLVWNAMNGHLSQFAALPTYGWLYLLLIACFSGVLSLWIYYRGLLTTKASVATIAELGYPLAAVIVNALTLGVVLEPLQAVGMLVLLLAVYRLGLARSAQ